MKPDLLGPLMFGMTAICAIAAIRLLARGVLSSVPRVAFRPMLSPAERRFLLVLIDALPGFIICPQVGMGALLKVDRSVEDKQFWATRNRFSQKIVDYALVDPASGNVVCLIELDDRTHDRARDEARDAMLKRAGYTVVRFANRPFPTVRSVCDALAFDPDLDGTAYSSHFRQSAA